MLPMLLYIDSMGIEFQNSDCCCAVHESSGVFIDLYISFSFRSVHFLLLDYPHGILFTIACHDRTSSTLLFVVIQLTLLCTEGLYSDMDFILLWSCKSVFHLYRVLLGITLNAKVAVHD